MRGQHGGGLAFGVMDVFLGSAGQQNIHALGVVPLSGPMQRGPPIDLVLRVDVRAFVEQRGERVQIPETRGLSQFLFHDQHWGRNEE